jgi:hypothetical protein
MWRKLVVSQNRIDQFERLAEPIGALGVVLEKIRKHPNLDSETHSKRHSFA